MGLLEQLQIRPLLQIEGSLCGISVYSWDVGSRFMKEKLQIQTLLRFPVLAVGFLTLVLALWGGLARIGWELPVTSTLPLQHGPLMISGFLGILISLERAIALGWGWHL